MKVVVVRGAGAVALFSLGLAVLASAPGAGAAPDPTGTEMVCRDTFGDTGPHLRPVADAAPGQVMSVGISWKKEEWTGNRLAEILTCASIDGRLAPELTARETAPDNDGATTVSLRMPADRVGSVVCGQSLLVGTADGTPSTSQATPFCFRLVATPAASMAPPPGEASVPAAPVPKEAPAPAEQPTVLGETQTREPASASPAPATPAPVPAEAVPGALAHTGTTDRWWTAAAGALLALGGLAVLLGAPAVRARTIRPR